MNFEKPDVLLLSMPWTAFTEPSLGLAILKSKLTQAEIECKVKHLNLLLLHYMRATTYLGITNMYALNEFFFTYVFEQQLSQQQLSELAVRVDEALFYAHFQDDRYKTKESVSELFLKIRNIIIPQYLVHCLQIVEESNATMVGFTCMFDQTIASLALAKMIKRKFPEKLIVFGGYALEGAPGQQIMDSFDFVDCVCYGEGENAIEQLAWSSVNRDLLKTIPNILYRSENYGKEVHRTSFNKPKIAMDESPVPDYDDFISDIAELKYKHNIEIKWDTLPIETSRGCWWGQTKHCIFCGIDDETMKYRQRSVDNTLSMLYFLREKYEVKHFRISDYILPHSYYKTLIPELAKLPEEDKFILSCELKANVSNEDFSLLRKAGFVEVQPGIESFSTSVLKKIDKGVSGIQNVYCLLLGHKNGIRVNYNFLYGFPNDTTEDYLELLKIIPHLYHLNPPSSRVEVAVTRFAPLQINPERFNMPTEQESNPGYKVIFSEEFLKKYSFNMNNYCYYFKTPYQIPNALRSVYRAIVFQIDYWKGEHLKREVKLYYEIKKNKIIFYDTRYDETPKKSTYNISYARVYLACTEKIMNLQSVVETLRNYMADKEITAIVDDLVNARLLYREGNKLIGLALNEKEYEFIKTESNKWAKPYV